VTPPGRHRRALITLAVLTAGTLATACAGSHHRAKPELLALDTYQVDGATGFEGTAVVRLDRRTLRPVGRRLRLGDAVNEDVYAPEPVRSPDGKSFVFGGYNFGELLFVDPARLSLTRKVRVVRGARSGDAQVDTLAWPRPKLLVALTTADGAWWAPHPAQLVFVDPERGRVLRRIPVRGGVDGVSVLKDGTVVLLRLPATFDGVPSGVPALETVDPNGQIRTLRLTRLNLHSREHVRVAGSSFRAERTAAFASDGGRRVFVTAARRPIAEVDVPSLRVRYHVVRIPDARLPAPGPTTPGSGGVHFLFSRSATWLGRDMLAISGYDELPAGLGGGVVGHRSVSTRVQVIDTRRWRLVRTLPATGCQPTRQVILCSRDVAVRKHGRPEIDTALLAYDRRWRIRYRKGPAPLFWQLIAGRLVVKRENGPAFELDPSSGRRIRRVSPPQYADKFFTWNPPG
jgi:hypothetical protein